MRKVSDGWHVVAGWDVYTENGYIHRGLSYDGQSAAYPYQKNPRGGYDRAFPTPDALRAGLKRGSYIMQ